MQWSFRSKPDKCITRLAVEIGGTLTDKTCSMLDDAGDCFVCCCPMPLPIGWPTLLTSLSIFSEMPRRMNCSSQKEGLFSSNDDIMDKVCSYASTSSSWLNTSTITSSSGESERESRESKELVAPVVPLCSVLLVRNATHLRVRLSAERRIPTI